MADPQFGCRRMQVLPGAEALVFSTSETVMALDGEDRDTFVRRLCSECGVGPADVVDIVFKAGVPQYARIVWAPSAERDYERINLQPE